MKRQVSPIAHEILDYLSDHPDAEDTVEGITEWWVLEECLKQQRAEVQRALDALVADGLLVKKPARYSDPRYRLSEGKLSELKKLLNPKE